MVVGETTIDVDVLVIGAGPGGYVAAIRAAQLGRKVHLVERAEIGGVCLNRGCIPSKALITAAQRYEAMRASAAMGLSAGQVEVDFSKVQEWKRGIVRSLTGGVEKLLKGNGVEIVPGEALFVGPNEVRVFQGNEYARYRFQAAIVAAGSRPVELSGFPFGGRILSSTEALALPEIPGRLIVIGGGYIGVELGQMYAKFGSRVTILEGAEHILPQFDMDIVRLLKRRLNADGVTVFEQAKARGAEETDTGVAVEFEHDGKVEALDADYVLVTVGRRPNADELGLEAAGIRIDDRGYIAVNERLETSAPGVYAIGDVVPGPALAHKASYEGKVAAEAIAGMSSVVDVRAIPAVVYSDPEVASVGLSASQAEAEGHTVRVGQFPYAANGRALTLGAKEGFVRLIGDAETGYLLGAQAVGVGASDLIAELGLAIEMGATVEDLALTVHAHPTLAEMVMEAADVFLDRPIHVLRKTKA